MPIADVTVPGSDGWWLARLALKFHGKPVRQAERVADDRRWEMSRADWLDMLWARFTGNSPLLRIADQYVDATLELMRLSKTNYAEMVVQALAHRTTLAGVRKVPRASGSPDAGSDADGDDQVRGFLAEWGEAFEDAKTFAYVFGTGFVMVSVDAQGDVCATAEDPRQIAVERDPRNPRKHRAVLKLYRDYDAQQDRAHLYLPAAGGQPDRVRVAVRDNVQTWNPQLLVFDDQNWSWADDVAPPGSPLSSGPLPVQGYGTPFVELTNWLGMGEFERNLDLIDRIANGIADRLWASKFQVFIQRAIKGDLPTTDPSTGQDIDYNDIFSADPAALWRLPDGVDLWESRQLDIQALLAPGRDDLKELSAVTQTPLYMFTPDAMTGSAEGASLARESITWKAEERITRFGPDAIRFCRLGLAYLGAPPAKDDQFEAIWLPIERYSLTARMQAGQAAAAAGVPTESRWTDVMGFPISAIPRMRNERLSDTLLNDAATPPTPATQTTTVGTPGQTPAPSGSQQTPPQAGTR